MSRRPEPSRPRTLSRRTFVELAAVLAGSAGCRLHTPRVPTIATGAGEQLDTDDGRILIDDKDPQQGPREAYCVVVIFSDFQCPFCKDVADVLARVRKELPNDVRLVFKHLPTSLHLHARAAAVASQQVFLAKGNAAFWDFHDRCFAHQADIDPGVLAAWMRDEGVDPNLPLPNEADRRVSEDIALAERLGIHGTPHLYINARSITGAYPYEPIREWIDDEL